MRVLIFYPPLNGPGTPMVTQNRQFQWSIGGSNLYPVVMASAASLLKAKGHKVYWYDANLSKEQSYEKIISRIDPNLIIFESKTPVIKQYWQIIDHIKTLYPHITSVLSGDHVTALPDESLENCKVDYIIKGGHYDLASLSLVQSLESHPPPTNRIIQDNLKSNLDDLPFIDRDLTHARSYHEKWRRKDPFYYMMASRDCHWGQCSFCSWTTLYPQYTRFSPERYLSEIEFLTNHHNAAEIFDDSGSFPQNEWLENFCSKVGTSGINRKVLLSSNARFSDLSDIGTLKMMRNAGIYRLKCGLESANEGTLEKINKGLSLADVEKGLLNAKKAGISIHLTTMFGYPWETKSDSQKTFDYVKELVYKNQIQSVQSTVLVPYPGTPLHKIMVDQDLIEIDANDYDSYDMKRPIIRPLHMSHKDINSFCKKTYHLHFSFPFILYRIFEVRSINDIKRVFRGVRAIINHTRDFILNIISRNA